MKIDLKRTPKETKEAAQAENMPQGLYPWGLSIHLDEDTIAKLPESFFDSLAINQPVALMVEGKVQSIGQEDTDQGLDRRVRIQITAFEFPDEKKAPADRIYPNEE